MLLALAGAYPAQAQQFGIPPRRLRLLDDEQNSATNPDGSKKKPDKDRIHRFGSVSILPLALFDVGGSFTSSNGTQTLLGSLVDVEIGTEDLSHTNTKGRYSIGGWYWGRDGNDLYELHARVQAPKGLGLQVGYLNTTQSFTARPGPPGQAVSTDAAAVDMFLFYQFASEPLAAKLSKLQLDKLTKQDRDRLQALLQADRDRKSGRWSVEIGAGLYIDMSKHYLFNTGFVSNNATANYTFYVSGTLQLRGNLSLVVNEWLLRDRVQELNRVGVGLGYSF